MRSEEVHNSNIRVLICLSASPSSRKVIRAAARFSHNTPGSLAAVYVDDGKGGKNSPSLRKNIELAESLGASVEVIRHRDVPEAITDYARQMSATDLFIGYSGPSQNMGGGSPGVKRLVRSLPEVDVHIIPDADIPLAPSKLDR